MYPFAGNGDAQENVSRLCELLSSRQAVQQQLHTLLSIFLDI
jgi:hypothetical protein